jgi:hypothetical protein
MAGMVGRVPQDLSHRCLHALTGAILSRKQPRIEKSRARIAEICEKGVWVWSFTDFPA